MTKTQVFFKYLSVLLVLADWPYLCLVAEDFGEDLTIDLAITNAKSTGFKVAVDFLKSFLQKMLNSFQKYYMLMLIPRYFSYLSSLSMIPYSISLTDSCSLTFWYRPCYCKLSQFYIFFCYCYCFQISA